MADEVGLFIAGGTTPGGVANANVRALRVATKLAPHQVGLAQDRVVASGRRLAAESYMGNADAWFTPDSAAGSNLHPDSDTPRTTIRARLVLTPGHTLLVTYLAVPSGDTEEDPGGLGSYQSAGPQGQIEVEITWTNADSDTDTRTESAVIVASQETNGAQPDGGGASYDKLISGKFEMWPDAFFDSAEDIAKWSQPGTIADILINHIGGARIVSAKVWEQPRVVGAEHDESPPACHLYSDEQGQPLEEYPVDYPVDFATQYAGGDDRFGSERFISTAHRNSELLGPTLFYWTAYTEHVDDVSDVGNYLPHTGNDDEWPHVSSTSDKTWQLAWNTSKTGWNDDDPALSIAAGGHARLYPSSGYPTTKNKTGVVRCRIGVWARLRTATGTGYVRVQTSRWSYVDIPVTGATFAWHRLRLAASLHG